MVTTIYPAYDGVVFKYASGTWNSIRNASSGTLNTIASYNITNSHTSGRGGNVYQIGRYFLEFDTSSINKTINLGRLSIFGNSTGALDVILVKGYQSGTVATTTFNDIYGGAVPLINSDGAGAGSFVSTDVVFYSDEVTTWNTSSYNTFTLNDAAKADIIANDTFNCVMIGFDFDGRDIAPSGTSDRTGFYQDNIAGTSRDPKLLIKEQRNSVFFGCNF